MCGIIGVIGERNATPILVEGLRRLEYRGYDSAGIAVAYQGELHISRAKGKLVNLQDQLTQEPRTGFVGIGHTRWATHGPPTVQNAHPHRSEQVAVVHNGIIENYQSLRQELMDDGVVFQSETDTEVIPHLINQMLKNHPDLAPAEAIRKAVAKLQGAFALGILIRGKEELLIAARRGSPLILGIGDGENFIASDATPLVPYTRRMVYLHDDDMAVLTKDGITLSDLAGNPVERPIKLTQVSSEVTDKWPYRHYMQKEIHEQPTAIGETLKDLIHPADRTVSISQAAVGLELPSIQTVTIVACGTSWHAGLVAKYWIEQLAKVPVQVDIASEYRYRKPPAQANGLMIVISQSGETADTLAALRYAKGQGQKVLGIVNVPESTIDRESDAVLHTHAGPEIGVASTKAFTTQLTVLACFALAMGKAKGELSPETEKTHIEALQQLPARIEQVLTHDERIQEIARDLMHSGGFLFLGRGPCFPIALEGALKLKEISYIHAEGYAAGEMKHGPIALIDEDLPVVVVAPEDELFDKVVSNVEEVKARGGRLVMITTQGEAEKRVPADYLLPVVPCGDFVAPILYVVPLQLLSYHIAVHKGTDVDQPRNLAKSVTVE
uniref:Glutamine--fructose-6-phosphate aminotransferase [isomerizing] n=1 Tax=Magnetococcus massalia (strain MO-1) TaxID=451514 RepID=A0A1S7LLU7_MAGMO|nr:L-glutamine:D-fructose-6-phosphate aminotransferase [Candidatus Magnetococcus massalia]